MSCHWQRRRCGQEVRKIHMEPESPPRARVKFENGEGRGKGEGKGEREWKEWKKKEKGMEREEW